jgi:AcrR family transcriptional regulator
MARQAISKANKAAEGALARTPSARASRVNDPEATKANILDVAVREFADKGLSGARIDEIAEQTRTSKRMIYYYFGSKEGLYLAVLQGCYRGIRNIETELKLEEVSPLEGLRNLVGSNFDYHNAHPDFSRLVMVENIHHGRHIHELESLAQENAAVIERIRRLCERGEALGVIRPGVDPIDLHMTISALCFFNVANRHTFSHIFRLNMGSKAALKARRESIIELVVRSVAA